MQIHLGGSRLWLDLDSLILSCAPALYARALDLYRTQRVLTLDIKPLDDPDHLGWLLQGDVQGSQRQPYAVSVDLTRDDLGHVLTWDSQCTCPVAEQCKHAVALLIKSAYKGQQLLGQMTPAAARPAPSAEQLALQQQEQAQRQKAAQLLQAENQLIRWLGELERTAPHNHPATSEARRPYDVTAREECFIYLLSISDPSGPKPLLSLEVVQSYRKLNGDWSKAKALRFTPERGQTSFDQASEADQDVLQLMRALPGGGARSYYSYNARTRTTLEGRLGVTLLEKAASTQRLFAGNAQSQPLQALQWGPAQRIHWHWQELPQGDESDSAWLPRARLESPSGKICLNNPPLYLDAEQGLCGLLDLQQLSAGQLSVLINTPALGTEALKKHRAALAQRLGSLPLPPMLGPLTTLSGITPVACLRLQAVPPDQIESLGLLTARLSYDYDGHQGWWAGQGGAVFIDGGPKGRLLLQRDTQAEIEAVLTLRAYGLTSHSQGQFYFPEPEQQVRWLNWADQDFAELRQAGFRLELDARLNDWVRHADALQVDLQSHDEDETTSPWFDLSLGMEINGQRQNILPWLPQLIDAAAHSPRQADSGLPDLPDYLYLNDPQTGGFVRLPTEGLKPWLQALLELVGDRTHDFSGDSLKLSRFDALRTTASLGAGVQWSGTQHLRDMVQQLHGRAELPEVALPAGVHASLRPYQQQGVNWLQFLREYSLSGILADDMGLGKTLQTLAHLQIEKDAGRLSEPALIIAPVSLMGNWRREAERFCPNLRVLVLHGAERHEAAGSMAEHDVVIAPYSLLHRDRERWLQARWHLVVLDEAQNIKNANSHAAQVASELTARHRLCLSGTPMENNLGELWSLFHFLMPGFLGSQKRFTELFRKPIEKQADPEALRQLRARVTPFMLRRTKALVAHELPPKVETVMRVELLGKQADLYETIRLGMEKTVREALSTKGLAKSQITILDALLKLRQVCCDPHLLKLDAAKRVKNSAKLEQLMEMLPEMLAEGRRILLFSQFTSMLSLIEAELSRKGIRWVKLTGQSQRRDALIEQFTSGQVPLFLISLKAGGVGLNLPQADTVIHYDPWWNPAVENQATDRAHRIGQTQSVWVVKLVAQGTIEERILALQERKAALADSMYSGSVARKQPLFSESDLAELLKPLSV